MARSSRSFRNLNLRVQQFTLRYQRAEAALTALIARTILSGTLGDPSVRRRVKNQVRTMLEELDRAGIPEGQRLVDMAYDMGRRIAGHNSLEGQITDEALGLLQASLEGRLTDATAHIGRRVDDVFRKEGLRAAASRIGGEDASIASDSMQRSLTRQGVSAFTDARGRIWSLADYAEMAVKTVTAEATFQGTQAVILDDGGDLVDVSHSDKCCDECTRYDGKTFSLTGATPNVPVLGVVFPIHPRCEHYIMPHAERKAA